MILSSATILREVHKGEIMINPFRETLLQPASYDLTWSGMWRGPYEEQAHAINTGSSLAIEPGQFLLLSTTEHIRLSTRFAGRVDGKSSWGRRGLLIHITAGFIDPGFEGHLTLEVFNCGQQAVHVRDQAPIAQLVVEQLTEEPLSPYRGRYQFQGVIPERAK
jgi:dCTP deaminase